LSVEAGIYPIGAFNRQISAFSLGAPGEALSVVSLNCTTLRGYA
jgi:hypothetical protein